MKCNVLILIVLCVVCTLVPGEPLLGEQLIKIGPVDMEALETLKGFWIIEKSQFTFEFTTDFACVVTGLKYYLYKRNQSTAVYPWVYTVVISRKTGRRYFARGNYRNGRFYGSTSRIVFEDRDHIIVYSSKEPEKIFFKAYRRMQPPVAQLPIKK